MKKALDSLGRDLEKGADQITRGGTDYIKSLHTFYCGFFFLLLMLVVPVGVIAIVGLGRGAVEEMHSWGREGQVYLALGYTLMAVGFPVRVLDVVLGVLYPFYDALTISLLGRFLGLTLCFLLSKLFLQSSFESYTSVRNSNTAYLLVRRYPCLFMSLLRLIYLPCGFESYLCAAFRVKYLSYLLPALVVQGCSTAGQLYLTRGLKTIAENLNFRTITEEDVYFATVQVGISVVMTVILVVLGKKLAEDEEALKDLAKEEA